MQSYNKENDGALYDPEIRDIFLDEMTYNTETIQLPTTVNEQYKSQQLLSIVLIGIVGARYGQEIEQVKPTNTLTRANSVENSDLIFKLSKISYLKVEKDNFMDAMEKIGRILANLLSPTNYDHIPLHSVIRRTAIDLIGRGYTVWEPYLDNGQVLLTLLDLCAISDSTTAPSK